MIDSACNNVRRYLLNKENEQHKENNHMVMSVVNVVGSLAIHTTKLGVYCNAWHKNTMALTKAFTTQVTVLVLAVLWFQELWDKDNGTTHASAKAQLLKESLMRLPICCRIVLKKQYQCYDYEVI